MYVHLLHLLFIYLIFFIFEKLSGVLTELMLLKMVSLYFNKSIFCKGKYDKYKTWEV